MHTDIKVIGKTKAGKKIGYRVPEGKNLYEACFTSGGEIPKELQGGWNDLRQLKNRIESYLNKTVSTRKAK